MVIADADMLHDRFWVQVQNLGNMRLGLPIADIHDDRVRMLLLYGFSSLERVKPLAAFLLLDRPGASRACADVASLFLR